MLFLQPFLLFRASDGVSPGAKTGGMVEEEWARRGAWPDCLLSLRTTMSGCTQRLLLDAFKFMTPQQGRSVRRGGAVEAGTIYNTFRVFGNWIIVPRTEGKMRVAGRRQKTAALHGISSAWTAVPDSNNEVVSVWETVYSRKLIGLLYLI